jgi:hypothetical protein
VHQFTAKDGRIYTIQYDLPIIRDIRRAIGIDLIGTEGIQKATSSVVDFAEVLWHTCRLQAERQGVDEASFIRSLESCLETATDAWLKEIARFFDSIGRAALARLAESLIATERADRHEANQVMDQKNAQRITQIQTRAQSTARRSALGKLLGESDESQNLTDGAPSPS